MPRKAPVSGRLPRTFKRTKAFVVANLALWSVIGGWYLFQPAERQRDVARLLANALDERKEITAFDVAWDLWQLYYAENLVAAKLPRDDSFAYGGPPGVTGLRPPYRLLRNTGYLAGYSDDLGNPLFAAYRVADLELKDAPPRPDKFVPDLRTTARIAPEAYNGTGYDRGHLAPNHAIATRYGAAAQMETFWMSNIIPQKHALNAGPWKRLEQRIATNYPGRFGEIWVFAGPVFGEKPVWLRRGLAQPEACYMIIVDEFEGKLRALAFLFPQDTPAEAALENHLTTIDEIERRTGLDFFAVLDDAAEAAFEFARAERAW